MSAMYLQNKYTKWYYSIVKNANERNTQGYVERHHIIPKSLGGSNNLDNIVKLTAREHYICHRLLTKITEGASRGKMLFALWAMSNQKGEFRPARDYFISSTVYEDLRRQVPELSKLNNTGRKYPNRKKPTMPDEQRQQRRERMITLNKSKKGRIVSEETREKIRIARAKQDTSGLIGRKRSPETIEKIKAKRALQTNVRNQYSSLKKL